MNGSTENRASNASEKPGKRDLILNLGTARRMLPLVGRIVGDIIQCQSRLADLGPERDRLDRRRQDLDWPLRQRRYQLGDELGHLELQLQQALAELENLGVSLLEAHEGRVGLPTVVNGHLAFFSWKPGEEGLRHWHFAGETVRRNIPATWKDTGDIRLLGKS